jgi:hypothetical protein
MMSVSWKECLQVFLDAHPDLMTIIDAGGIDAALAERYVLSDKHFSIAITDEVYALYRNTSWGDRWASVLMFCPTACFLDDANTNTRYIRFSRSVLQQLKQPAVTTRERRPIFRDAEDQEGGELLIPTGVGGDVVVPLSVEYALQLSHDLIGWVKRTRVIAGGRDGAAH